MTSLSPIAGIRLNHTGLRVANIDRSVAFYTQAFGMVELARIPSDSVTLAILGYADAEDASLPLLKRQGVLELACAKVRSVVVGVAGVSMADQLVCRILPSRRETRRSSIIVARLRCALRFLIWRGR
jgi:catechol 2,3-dioxygenase-like lactoylglutathione lyase family enzyme